MESTTRREALVLIASASPLVAQAGHSHTEAAPAAAYRPVTLTAAEMAAVGALCDLIIPRTDTPGASEAGVPEFIDRRLSASPGLAASFRSGMALAGSDFSKLREFSEQPDTPGGRFFKLLKEMTIDGYYSSRVGLMEELGWHGNTFVSEFKGCTHPEHQG